MSDETNESDRERFPAKQHHDDAHDEIATSLPVVAFLQSRLPWFYNATDEQLAAFLNTTDPAEMYWFGQTVADLSQWWARLQARYAREQHKRPHLVPSQEREDE